MLRFDKYVGGKPFVGEYGSPDNEADFRALLAYSPYHHVTRAAKYPSILVLTSDSDDRVDPMHARKFAAMLQARSAGGPVLLRVEQKAGHGGSGKKSDWVEETADMFAFAFAKLTAVGGSVGKGDRH
jgi:prolyl oligopeptidase